MMMPPSLRLVWLVFLACKQELLLLGFHPHIPVPPTHLVASLAGQLFTQAAGPDHSVCLADINV